MSFDYLCKIVCIGDAGSGKSTLVTSYGQGLYTPYIWDDGEPRGVDFIVKNLTINSQRIKLQVWDTAGQERFRTITSSYYRGSHVILIFYDVSHHRSFQNVSRWYKEIKIYRPEAIIILVGNKSDSQHREITYDQGLQLAHELNIDFFETSAKTYNQVNELFHHCATVAIEQFPQTKVGEKSPTKEIIKENIKCLLL